MGSSRLVSDEEDASRLAVWGAVALILDFTILVILVISSFGQLLFYSLAGVFHDRVSASP